MEIGIDKAVSKRYKSKLLKYVGILKDVNKIDDPNEFENELSTIRTAIKLEAQVEIDEGKINLLLIKSVLLDLCGQGWGVKVSNNGIILSRDENKEIDKTAAKDIIRKSHILLRNEQLRIPSVRDFIWRMERSRLTAKGWHSIFSLMRDGKKFAEKLITAQKIKNYKNRFEYLSKTISPYIQFAEANKKCEYTDLALLDIWRYFRHTWVTPYKMLPGRSIAILIRDSAALNHPIIGIGALGSSVAQHTTRDKWIGWESRDFVTNLHNNSSSKISRHLFESVERLLNNIYKKDLIKEKIIRPSDLKNPSDRVIELLKSEAKRTKSIHWKHRNKSEYNALKQNHFEQNTNWGKFSVLPLYKSKRCNTLANILRIKKIFIENNFYGKKHQLREALNNSKFKGAISSLIRQIKAERVGINMMDIVICGAVAPYQPILGGKLICHLLISPEVNLYYKKKYKNSVSIIASSMKGEKVKYNQDLVMLGTTSLYGVGSSQYNRIKIPIKHIGGIGEDFIRYEQLGYSEGFGSFHFSKTSLDLMETVVGKDERGMIVNRIFGEGANPLMRLIRQALTRVKLPSKEILQHGYKRVVYGVALASNFKEILLGLNKKPKYYLSMKNPQKTTELLAKYWIERWLLRRIEREEVIKEVAKHNLVYPIEHGARVVLPELEEAGLFDK